MGITTKKKQKKMGGEGSDDKCQYMSVEWMNIRILREHGAHRCWDRIFYTMVCSFHGSASNMCHGRDSTTTLSASLEKKKTVSQFCPETS